MFDPETGISLLGKPNPFQDLDNLSGGGADLLKYLQSTKVNEVSIESIIANFRANELFISRHAGIAYCITNISLSGNGGSEECLGPISRIFFNTHKDYWCGNRGLYLHTPQVY